MPWSAKVFRSFNIHQDKVEVGILIVFGKPHHLDLDRLIPFQLQDVRLVKPPAAAAGVHFAGKKLDFALRDRRPRDYKQ